MREVSCRAISTLLDALRRRRLPLDPFLEGIPHDVAFLSNRNEYVDWPVYMRLLANMRKVLSDGDFVDIGAAVLQSPLLRPMFIMARQFHTTASLYRWTNGDSGPGVQMFTCVSTSFEELGPNILRITHRFAAGYPMSREFCLISKGALMVIPRFFFGLPEATVDMEPGPAEMCYTVSYPSGSGELIRLRNLLIAPFRSWAAVRELREAHESLQQRYFELERARVRLGHQTTVLETAGRISQAIHGDLNLETALQAIALALVEVAEFAAVEVAVDAMLEGQPMRVRTQNGVPPEAVFPSKLEVVVRQGVGQVILWPRTGGLVNVDEFSKYVLPTIHIAMENALAYTALSLHRSQLEERVAQRTAELQRTSDSLAATVISLEQAQATRDRIFANINHEIRTPLSLIVLASADLKERNFAQLDAQAGHDIVSIDTSVHRLLNLVDGLLLLAAGQEGKLLLQPVATDLATLLQASVGVWGPAAAAAKVTLYYSGPPRLQAKVDENAVERILSNLLSNALKFTPAGGSIRLHLGEAAEGLEITVQDTGSGIDEELKGRIFGRFEQGKNHSRGMRGSGIGLSLVKELIEAHGGRVHADNNTSGGAIFTLTLPRSVMLAGLSVRPDLRGETPRISHAADVPTPWPGPASGQQQYWPRSGTAVATILCAEDDPQLAAALGRILSATYHVLVAPDGLTALKLACENLPDLLVSDVEMPGMDGLELTRRFLSIPGNRLTPVLLVTAHKNLGDRLEGFAAGAIDYIAKPFAPEELRARIRAQLALRQMALRLSDSERLVALGGLVAGLAHELRNPANAVVNAIEPLCAVLPPAAIAPGTAAADLIEVMQSGAEQLCMLSKQLLGFLRPSDLITQQENVEALIVRALSLVRLERVTVSQDVQCAGAVPCIPSLIVQTLANLFENAVHATDGKGLLRIEAKAEGDILRILVADNGPGVPPELRARIFDPFFTTKAPGAGTGLGLSSVRTIVEHHAGRISLLDSVEGALFCLELPLRPS